MTGAEKRPEDGDLPNPGDDSACGHQTDDHADLEEEHQLQRPPPSHLLPLLYLELHAARIPARVYPSVLPLLTNVTRDSRTGKTFGTRVGDSLQKARFRVARMKTDVRGPLYAE